MNCQDFNDRLYEYLDESLSRDARAEAGEHLRQCSVCRSVLLREETFAKSIRHSFDRATAGLSIRTETQRRVLAAWKSKCALSDGWTRAWQTLSVIPVRPIGAAAALLAVLLLFSGIQFRRQAQQVSELQATAQGDRDTWVIDVTIQTQTRVFRRENNAIVDAIIPNVTIGRAYFPDNSERLSKPR